MLTIGPYRVSIIVLAVVTLHLFWAAAIMVDDGPLGVNSINALVRYVHPPMLLVLLLVLTSASAVAGMVTKRRWSSLMLIPQQVLLVMSASGAVESAWLGQFADGVLRSHAFIAADQFYAVTLAVWHTVAITVHSLRGRP